MVAGSFDSGKWKRSDSLFTFFPIGIAQFSGFSDSSSQLTWVVGAYYYRELVNGQLNIFESKILQIGVIAIKTIQV